MARWYLLKHKIILHCVVLCYPLAQLYLLQRKNGANTQFRAFYWTPPTATQNMICSMVEKHFLPEMCPSRTKCISEVQCFDAAILFSFLSLSKYV